ncbi:protein ITPRID2-like [Megalops cyprinoides]|uniref:protein ITPRID2-like n=1 Tax=Megalops cyprinoides TaxID=118141 RepID=UPI0018644792|nr:protein ITPRID2-like [Megalops cyprinoides]XP_036401609.1 protein ITPRID2-like [Megalops cyprinoides]XP_036401610.1 protein ITPRID2-like [Megalops cyprinoides]
MEECESPVDPHPWKTATVKRKAWALSRDSWQASESQDGGAEAQQPQELAEEGEEKGPLAEEPGRIPNKITSWLQECRTPLGASLDEQSNTPTKGPLKNGCSFEDDLSLGAEANHLRANGVPTEEQRFGMLAQDKRSQFKQKGRSMNSTGSGKSSTTVSSVSELLDLYEEDPEEILYNLGFGTEEPDIAAKIPSRFFNSSSYAKGIDIKVYLGAQLRRMELESPSYALTSRFRQIEVLTTVANAFSSLYSQVSGAPVQRIGSCDAEPKEPPPLRRNNSALNAAKILKKSITKLNLHAAGDENPPSACSDAEKERGSSPTAADGPADSDHRGEQRQRTSFKKEHPSLATVTEEPPHGPSDPLLSGVSDHIPSVPPDSDGVPPREPDFAPPKDPAVSSEDSPERGKGNAVTETSTPEKGPPNQLAHPCLTHLLSQAKDSFEMEEVQSNEGETLPGTLCPVRAGNESLLRTASQHSDSSGFAEDPSADCSSNYLKVQESSDSCDSETTVTSNAGDLGTPLAVESPAFEQLQGGTAEALTATVLDDSDLQDPSALSGSQCEAEEEEEVEIPKYTPHQLPKHTVRQASENEEPGLTGGPGCTVELGSATDPRPSPEPVSGTPNRARGALQRSHQAMSVCEGRGTPVWVRDGALLCDRDRAPLRRSVSLPTSLRPSRVVSSVKIQLRPGNVRLCTPPSFSYRYTPEEEEEEEAGQGVGQGAAQEAEGEESPCRSTLIISSLPQEKAPPSATLDGPDPPSRMPPYPLHMPPHLTHSTCSLHSTPPDWPDQPLCEKSRSWSTCSMPALPAHSAPYSSPYNNLHGAPYSSPYINLHGAPYSSPYGNPSSAPFHHNAPQRNHYSSSYGNLKSAPYSSTYNNPNSAPYSLPYGNPSSAPFHHSAPQSNRCNSPFGNPYIAPYSSPYGHPHPASYHHRVAQSPQSAPYSTLCPPPFPHPYTPPPAAPPASSTEAQLRRVLHDIRGAVHNLAQSSSLRGEDMATHLFSTQRAGQPLHESGFQELQVMRKSLSLFRTQMMDLELALIRQQDMMYQHLTEEERQEAEQLQNLRSAVRQELQELELQLEDRLLSLDEQLRSSQLSGLYRHPVGVRRGQSFDSLCSSPSLNVREPVAELLREQLYLQEEVGVGGGGSSAASLASGYSSGSDSPSRPGRPLGTPTPKHPSPQRAGVYRASVCLTPAPPPRPQAAAPHGADSTLPTPPEERGGGGGGGGAESPHLQQLIKEIRQSLADEIRQEIVNELLAAVSPRRSPVATGEPTL